MKNTARKGAAAMLILLLAVIAVLTVRSVKAQPPATAVRVSAAIYAVYDFSFEGVGGWVGNAIFTFGDKPEVNAKYFCRSNGVTPFPDGSILGVETCTYTLADGSGSFDLQASWYGAPAPEPRLYNLHEIGTLKNGTGVFAKASGQLTVTGPFMKPVPPIEGFTPVFVGTIHGAVEGVN